MSIVCLFWSHSEVKLDKVGWHRSLKSLMWRPLVAPCRCGLSRWWSDLLVITRLTHGCRSSWSGVHSLCSCNMKGCNSVIQSLPCNFNFQCASINYKYKGKGWEKSRFFELNLQLMASHSSLTACYLICMRVRCINYIRCWGLDLGNLSARWSSKF